MRVNYIDYLCIIVTRVGGGSAVDIVDKEVSSLADLSEGDILRGYVVSAGSIGVLVRLATPPAVGNFL